MRDRRRIAVIFWIAFWAWSPPTRGSQPDPETEAQLRELRQQNQLLQQQLQRQQTLIDELSRKVSLIQAPAEPPKTEANPPQENERNRTAFVVESALSKIHLSGEGSAGFFESQAHGQFPNSEFRVDEAKLFVDAPIWDEVYFFSELNLLLREDPNLNLRAGELYVDVEDVSRLWNKDRQLNIRLGQMDIPFGEEYLTRDAIDNPLISHSIMDFWGVDEGVEFYGDVHKVQYVLAVQNGGHGPLRDFTGDKAVVLRVGGDPTPWLHLSASAMRTGDLDVGSDKLSELWIGSGFIHSLGSTNTTRFAGNLVQGDVQLHLGDTRFSASGGVLQYRDNDPSADNTREVWFYSLEATQKLYRGLYAAARWSQAFAPKGFPLIGNGNVGDYFAKELTRDLSLLSLGLGYRFSKQFVVKAEYSFEWGHELDGTPRRQENLFALVTSFAF
jgi:hypothetical protein